MLHLPPSFIKIARQNGFHSDCGIAALAMFAGVPYEEALAMAIMVVPGILTEGLTMRDELPRVAELLGCKIQIRRRGYYVIDEDTGILGISKRGQRDATHVVYLWEGRVIEGADELWLDPEDFCKTRGYYPRELLVRVE